MKHWRIKTFASSGIITAIVSICLAIIFNWNAGDLLWNAWTAGLVQALLIVFFAAIGPATDSIDSRIPAILRTSPKQANKNDFSLSILVFGMLFVGVWYLGFSVFLDEHFPISILPTLANADANLPSRSDVLFSLGSRISQRYSLPAAVHLIAAIPYFLRWRHDPHGAETSVPLAIKLFISIFVFAGLHSIKAPGWASYIAITIIFFPWKDLKLISNKKLDSEDREMTND